MAAAGAARAAAVLVAGCGAPEHAAFHPAADRLRVRRALGGLLDLVARGQCQHHRPALGGSGRLGTGLGEVVIDLVEILVEIDSAAIRGRRGQIALPPPQFHDASPGRNHTVRPAPR
ncbi:hypothetical protein FRAHR75_10141 [Frankia sp. Hr75.2]|nr:hypothetical protein FRAHR75_10141 [Frankia sp. Hr75.2]